MCSGIGERQRRAHNSSSIGGEREEGGRRRGEGRVAGGRKGREGLEKKRREVIGRERKEYTYKCF